MPKKRGKQAKQQDTTIGLTRAKIVGTVKEALYCKK